MCVTARDACAFKPLFCLTVPFALYSWEFILIRRAAAFAATALVLMAATTAGAAQTQWFCEIPEGKVPRGVPPQYLVGYDKSTGEALVADGLIMKYKKAPIPAKFSKKGGEVIFSWIVTGIPSRNARTYSARFALSIDEKAKTMKVDYKMLGYDNFPASARGTCKLVK